MVHSLSSVPGEQGGVDKKAKRGDGGERAAFTDTDTTHTHQPVRWIRVWLNGFFGGISFKSSIFVAFSSALPANGRDAIIPLPERE